mmetsp:Transcript_49778/g.159026  ORF Transcript_49778/g.159026 Transcript_49778/m.159026 type:complete len:268 (-) Transcript_49778:100-903(-)
MPSQNPESAENAPARMASRSATLVRGAASVALVLLLACSAPGNVAGFTSEMGASGFDFFYFVQTWPAEFCEKMKCNVDTLKKSDGFTIHGLWPNFMNGTYPASCDSRPFDEAKIADLLPRLKQEWPDLKGMGDWLWTHEWTKHGTCAKSVTPDEHAYFQAALDLRAGIDFLAALRGAQVVPGAASYKVADLESAMASATGGIVPTVHCKAGEVAEAWVCVSKDLEVIECPIKDRPSCPAVAKLPSLPAGRALRGGTRVPVPVRRLLR